MIVIPTANATAAADRFFNAVYLLCVTSFHAQVGNFMNGGTSRGGLYGYRLDALFKLATIKSVDQKRNLMNYLADWCAYILALFG